MSLPGGSHFLIKMWSFPKTCRLQWWDASGPTTKRAGTQTHSSADRLLKVLMSKQLPQKHHLTQPCPPEGQNPPQTPVGRYQSLPPGSLYKPLRQPHPPESRQQRQEELQPCSLWNANHNHRNLDKMRWQRNLSQMKEEDKT